MIIKKLGKRNCKWCGIRFQKKNLIQPVCSISCAIAYNEDKRNKAEYKKWKNSKSRKKMKDNTTTISQLKKKLETNINEIVRKIDHENNCMMCDSEMKPNACHHHAVGSNDTLRFNLLNIWGGCYSCNGNKGGNINGYDMQLLQTYGRDRWEYIKFDLVCEYPLLKLSRDEIKELTKSTRKICNVLEAKKRSSMDRWLLREKLNEEIGIYK